MTLADALLALERAGGGLTVTPTRVEVFVPVTRPGTTMSSWRNKMTKRRSGDNYVMLVTRGIEKALGEEGE